jgi:predicted DNA-binding transcriptional regulator YafY
MATEGKGNGCYNKKKLSEINYISMSKRESVSRWNLIIKKLRKYPCKYSEISDYLADESDLQGYDYNVSKLTFQRDVEDIRSIYNIDIQYDFSRRVYYIDSQENPDVSERILEAFDTFNALNISERLSNYIHFEKRRSTGTENLYGLLHAIKNKFLVSFKYQKFWDDEPSGRTAEPYALKEHKNRWYVIARDLKDCNIKTFALDRLSDLDITKTRYNTPLEFNVDDYFKHSFGIIRPETETPEDVLLAFEPHQGKYIKSLPLHESQEVISDNEDEIQIRLRIFITHDFIMELLSYGETVRVLKPQSLIEGIKKVYDSSLKQY